MTPQQMKGLAPGDFIRRNSTDARNETYIVTGNYGNRVTAARTVDLTNAPEWLIVMKATHEPS